MRRTPLVCRCMAVNEQRGIWWPVHGLLYFLSRPQLWFGPIVATLLAWLITCIMAVLILWHFWPGAEVEGFWANCLAVMTAFAFAAIGFVALWMIGIPFVISIAYERLVINIFKLHGIERFEEESFFSSVMSSLSLLLRSLPWRLLWISLSLICTLFLPPLAILIAAVGLGHTSMLDAGETVLALQGRNGKQRKAFFKQHRSEFFSAGIIAGLLSILLSCTFIGLLFWLPGMMSAAAIELPRWAGDDE